MIRSNQSRSAAPSAPTVMLSKQDYSGLLLFGMLVAHQIHVGDARYLPIMGLIVGYLLVYRSVHIVPSFWFNFGGLLCVGGATVANLLNPGFKELFYGIFMPLNFFMLPVFARKPVHAFHLKLIFWLGVLFVLPSAPEGPRWNSLFVTNTNMYAMLTMCVTYLGMVAYANSRWRQALVFAGSVVIIFFSASRGHLGAILIFGGVYYGQRILNANFRWLLISILGGIAFLYVSLVTDDRFQIMTAIQENTVSDKKEKGLSHRDMLFNICLELQQEYPLGVGIGNAEDYIEERSGYALSPHNMYLRMLTEGGAIMLIGYLIILIYMLLTTKSYLASAMIVAICFRGFFESSMPFTLTLLSMLMVLPYFMNETTVDRKTVRFTTLNNSHRK